jgi:hypothetical protein
MWMLRTAMDLGSVDRGVGLAFMLPPNKIQ